MPAAVSATSLSNPIGMVGKGVAGSDTGIEVTTRSSPPRGSNLRTGRKTGESVSPSPSYFSLSSSNFGVGSGAILRTFSSLPSAACPPTASRPSLTSDAVYISEDATTGSISESSSSNSYTSVHAVKSHNLLCRNRCGNDFTAQDNSASSSAIRDYLCLKPLDVANSSSCIDQKSNSETASSFAFPSSFTVRHQSSLAEEKDITHPKSLSPLSPISQSATSSSDTLPRCSVGDPVKSHLATLSSLEEPSRPTSQRQLRTLTVKVQRTVAKSNKSEARKTSQSESLGHRSHRPKNPTTSGRGTKERIVCSKNVNGQNSTVASQSVKGDTYLSGVESNLLNKLKATDRSDFIRKMAVGPDRGGRRGRRTDSILRISSTVGSNVGSGVVNMAKSANLSSSRICRARGASQRGNLSKKVPRKQTMSQVSKQQSVRLALHEQGALSLPLDSSSPTSSSSVSDSESLINQVIGTSSRHRSVTKRTGCLRISHSFSASSTSPGSDKRSSATSNSSTQNRQKWPSWKYFGQKASSRSRTYRLPSRADDTYEGLSKLAYFQMIKLALLAMRSQGGSTTQEIGDYICHHYDKDDSAAFRCFLNRMIREFTDRGRVKQIRRGLYTLTRYEFRIFKTTRRCPINPSSFGNRTLGIRELMQQIIHQQQECMSKNQLRGDCIQTGGGTGCRRVENSNKDGDEDVNLRAEDVDDNASPEGIHQAENRRQLVGKFSYSYSDNDSLSSAGNTGCSGTSSSSRRKNGTLSSLARSIRSGLSGFSISSQPFSPHQLGGLDTSASTTSPQSPTTLRSSNSGSVVTAGSLAVTFCSASFSAIAHSLSSIFTNSSLPSHVSLKKLKDSHDVVSSPTASVDHSCGSKNSSRSPVSAEHTPEECSSSSFSNPRHTSLSLLHARPDDIASSVYRESGGNFCTLAVCYCGKINCSQARRFFVENDGCLNDWDGTSIVSSTFARDRVMILPSFHTLRKALIGPTQSSLYYPDGYMSHASHRESSTWIGGESDPGGGLVCGRSSFSSNDDCGSVMQEVDESHTSDRELVERASTPCGECLCCKNSGMATIDQPKSSSLLPFCTFDSLNGVSLHDNKHLSDGSVNTAPPVLQRMMSLSNIVGGLNKREDGEGSGFMTAASCRVACPFFQYHSRLAISGQAAEPCNTGRLPSCNNRPLRGRPPGSSGRSGSSCPSSSSKSSNINLCARQAKKKRKLSSSPMMPSTTIPPGKTTPLRGSCVHISPTASPQSHCYTQSDQEHKTQLLPVLPSDNLVRAGTRGRGRKGIGRGSRGVRGGRSRGPLVAAVGRGRPCRISYVDSNNRTSDSFLSCSVSSENRSSDMKDVVLALDNDERPLGDTSLISTSSTKSQSRVEPLPSNTCDKVTERAGKARKGKGRKGKGRSQDSADSAAVRVTVNEKGSKASPKTGLSLAVIRKHLGSVKGLGRKAAEVQAKKLSGEQRDVKVEHKTSKDNEIVSDRSITPLKPSQPSSAVLHLKKRDQIMEPPEEGGRLGNQSKSSPAIKAATCTKPQKPLAIKKSIGKKSMVSSRLSVQKTGKNVKGRSHGSSNIPVSPSIGKTRMKSSSVPSRLPPSPSTTPHSSSAASGEKPSCDSSNSRRSGRSTINDGDKKQGVRHRRRLPKRGGVLLRSSLKARGGTSLWVGITD